MLLFESGCRMHVTEFEWPKNLHPSGFSMKVCFLCGERKDRFSLLQALVRGSGSLLVLCSSINSAC